MIIEGVEEAMEIVHEPGLDAYQEHEIYKGLMDKVTDKNGL